jgi:hypothetical protein
MINIEYQKIKKHYKYRLRYTVKLETKITGYFIRRPFIELLTNGKLTIYKKYAWNGADFPVRDTKNIMAASLVHDVFCQLVEDGRIPLKEVPEINNLMLEICDSKGMSKIRQKWIKWGIDKFCNPHLTEEEQKIYKA